MFTNRLQVYESLSLASKGIAKFSRRAASRVDAIISTDSTAGSSSSTDNGINAITAFTGPTHPDILDPTLVVPIRSSSLNSVAVMESHLDFAAIKKVFQN